MFRIQADEVKTLKSEEQLTILNNYVITRHGASILFYNRNSEGTLAACFNPFDRTFFIIDPNAHEFAALIGTKRFLVGLARSAEIPGTIQHPRDLSCPLSLEEKSVEGYTLEQVLDL